MIDWFIHPPRVCTPLRAIQYILVPWPRRLLSTRARDPIRQRRWEASFPRNLSEDICSLLLGFLWGKGCTLCPRAPLPVSSSLSLFLWEDPHLPQGPSIHEMSCLYRKDLCLCHSVQTVLCVDSGEVQHVMSFMRTLCRWNRFEFYSTIVRHKQYHLISSLSQQSN